MVVLLCCVDQLTTSHISIWAPPHLSFPILANILLSIFFKKLLVPKYPERGMDGLWHHLHSGKRNPSQWNPSPVFLGVETHQVGRRYTSKWVKHLKKQNRHKFCLAFTCDLLILCLNKYTRRIFLRQRRNLKILKVVGNRLDGAFVVLSHR